MSFTDTYITSHSKFSSSSLGSSQAYDAMYTIPLGHFAGPLQKSKILELTNKKEEYYSKWTHMKGKRDARDRAETMRKERQGLARNIKRFVMHTERDVMGDMLSHTDTSI